MIDFLVVLASLGVVIATALLGRRFISVDDAEHSVIGSEDDVAGWVPQGLDEQILESTRREMATHTRSNGLTY
jgi:hypothetical protein